MPDFLLNVLDRQQSVLVFPSEVVARFWRRSALQHSGRRALSAERVISWDAFKERVFEIRAQARPINATVRRIFVTQLLRENQNEPFLRAIVNPDYRDNSAAFVGLVQRSLPALQLLADRGALRRASEPLLQDLATVYQRYSVFLDAGGLFEPGWHRAGISAPRAAHTVMFAELIEDYAEFAADLSSAATVSTIPLTAVAAADRNGAKPAVYEYSNAHQEVSAVLSQVEKLLDQGVEADDIAISVAELEQYQPFLQRYADLHAIPLLFRSGQPLSESAAGRLIRGLSTAVSSGFAFDALRGLLLDHALPWRKPHHGRELVRAAIEAGCLKQRLGSRSLSAGTGSAAGSAAATAAGEQWLRAIAVSGAERAALKQYYLGLRDSLNGIASARGATELRQRLLAFVRRFLDSDGWDPDNLKRFQRALDELKQLAAAEASLGVTVEDSYALWLGLLDQTLYVARSEHGGVAVFPYRVAAGVRPRYHFVINASHDGTRVLENPFSFVREDLRERLGLGEKDFSDAFLRAYALSGEAVQFSYSVQSFAGPRFAAGHLAGSVEPASAETDDLYRIERERWNNGLEHVPPRLYPDQARGLASIARTGLQRRGTDFSRQAVPAGTLRERLLQRTMAQTPAAAGAGAEALVALSANRIDSYRSCPFGHLLQHPLGIAELDFTVAVQPALAVGTYQHAVLEALYRRIAQDDPLLRPELIERYEQILDEVLCDQSLLRSATRRLPRPVATLVSRITGDGVRRLLRAELELIGPQRVEHTEFQLSRVFSRTGVQLSGRIDRVSRYPGDNSSILVDYKRRGSAGRTQVVGRDGDPAAITTVQLPLYMLLLEQDGRRVERAYYFQVETGKIVTVLAPDSRRYSLSDDQRRRLLDYVVQLIDDVASGLRGGDYRFADPGVGCSECRFRGICRARFAVQQE